LASATGKCLTAYQSINKSVMTMYGAAGHLGRG
jgi:hypothetical protein